MSFRSFAVRSGYQRILLISCAAFLVITILLPLFTIVLVSFVPSSSWMVNYFPDALTLQNYSAIFSSSRKLEPFVNSLVMALAAGLLGLLVGIPSSAIIVKSSTRLKWPVEFLVLLPWAIPCSAVAINLINGFNTPSIFSGQRVLVGTSILLPLGYFIRSLPILVKILNVSFQNLSDGYLEASKSLGGTGLQTFRRIGVPMLFPGILAGFLLLFIRSIGEYTVSVFLYNASNKPMAIAMVNGVFEYNIGLAMAYGSLLLVMTLLLTLVISRVLSLAAPQV